MSTNARGCTIRFETLNSISNDTDLFYFESRDDMFFQKTVLYKGGGQDDRVMAPKLSSEELQPVKRI